MKALALIWWQWLVGHARGIWNAPAPPRMLPPARRQDPATLEQQVRRGNEARSLLDNPLFIEAARAVEDSLTLARRQVPLADQTMHTRIILAGQQWELLRGYIEQLMVTGELAGRDLLRKQSAATRLSLAFRRGFRS